MSFNWTPDELQELVDNNKIVLFMKGTPDEPRCGFSNRAASVLKELQEPFASVNILSDPRANTFGMCMVRFSNNATSFYQW